MTYNLTLDEAYSTMVESKALMNKALATFYKTHSKTAGARLAKATLAFEKAMKSYKDLENQIHNLRPLTLTHDEAWQVRNASLESMTQEDKAKARYEDYHTAMEFDAMAYGCTCREEWQKASYFLGIANWARMGWWALPVSRKGTEARDALRKEEQRGRLGQLEVSGGRLGQLDGQRGRLGQLAVAYSRAERAWLQGKTELAAGILAGAESMRVQFSICPMARWIQIKELIVDAMAKKAHCEASTGMF